MRSTLLMGNWKMFGSLAFVENWLQNFSIKKIQDQTEVVIFPPFPYLASLIKLCHDKKITVGAQNCASKKEGAYTGEVSPYMLKDLGCHYVLLGHSERRQLYHEKNNELREKLSCALEAGLVPVFCIGETELEREQGQAFEVLKSQLSCILDKIHSATIVLAYEPVWAIGTGKVASPSQVQEIHAYLRGLLAQVSPALAERTCILYGGSVKPDNAQSLLSLPDVDGALIGGASLRPLDFLAIYDTIGAI